MYKVALCFILNYEHELIKENIWQKWIEHNKDIINVYFYYSDYSKIKSQWIKEHAIPNSYIVPTDYTHVLGAYLGVIKYAYTNADNQWFIYLTDFCCPIIHPYKFRQIFFENYNHSFLKWRTAWWDVKKVARANLQQLPMEYHLANSPWFTLSRFHATYIVIFSTNPDTLNMTKTIMTGMIANESFFAIVLKHYDLLYNTKTLNKVICENTHVADWVHMSSATSPYFFKNGNAIEYNTIISLINDNKYAMFIRKVDSTFPDNVLNKIIYNINKLPHDIIPYSPIPYYIKYKYYSNKIKIQLNNKCNREIVNIFLGAFIIGYLYVVYLFYSQNEHIRIPHREG